MPSSETWAEPCRQLPTRIREHCLRMTHRGRSGHVGSMLSMAEILAVLYTRVLRVDPQNPGWPDRDRFVLSKGHGGGAVYAVLGELGFFPKEWFEGKGVSWMKNTVSCHYGSVTGEQLAQALKEVGAAS